MDDGDEPGTFWPILLILALAVLILVAVLSPLGDWLVNP